jgi:hypothetical protein
MDHSSQSHFHDSDSSSWPSDEVRFAQSELACSFPDVSEPLIDEVISRTQNLVQPSKGREKLVESAKKSLEFRRTH